MAWVDVFGAPAGAGEETRLSPAVPAGAPVPTPNRLKLTHSVTHREREEKEDTSIGAHVVTFSNLSSFIYD